MLGQLIGVLLGCSADAYCPGFTECPANTPGFQVAFVEGGDAGVSLRLGDGGTVAVELVGTVVKPAMPLIPGETYVLRHLCQFDWGGEHSFTAGPSKPLPARTGSIKVVETGRRMVSIPGGSACVTDVDAAFARFEIAPDPDLVPFLGVASWSLELDGKTTWTKQGAGGVSQAGLVMQSVLSRRLDFVHSLCKRPQNADQGIDPGLHVARLRAELAGSDALEPAEVSFTLDCGMDVPAGSSGGGCEASPPGVFALLGLGLLLLRRPRSAPFC